MAILPHKKRNITVLLVPLVMGALFVCGFLFYSIQAKTEEGGQALVLIAEADESQSNAISMKNFLRNTEETRSELNEYFITSGTIVTFIERLESLGRLAGADILLTTVEAGTAQSPSLKASFKMSGSFESLYYFLSLMEALPLELEVKRVTLAKLTALPGKSTAGWEGEGNIELLSFIPE